MIKFIITEPYIINRARFVTITTLKKGTDGYVPDKEFLCKNIDVPYTNDSSYNLLNMLTNYEFKDMYIKNPYTLLKEYALFVGGVIIKPKNKFVPLSNDTVCINDIRKEIREFAEVY